MTGYYRLGLWLFLFFHISFTSFAAPNCKNLNAPKDPNAIAGNPVQFEGRTYPHLVYDNFKYNPGAIYMRPEGNREENLKKAKKVVIYLHGVGADFSNPNSMLHQYGNYTGTSGIGANGKAKQSYGKRQILNNYAWREGEIYGEIVPLPGSTFGGADIKDLGTSIHKAALQPLKKYIEELRRLIPPDAEIIIHGRSYGATLAASFAHEFHGLVDKMILVGLATPRRDIMEEVENRIREVEEAGKRGEGEPFDQNWDWTHWFNKIIVQSKWFDTNKLKTLFGGTKTLILIGETDFQVTPEERIIYGDMALKYPNVDMRIVPAIDHDASKTKQNSNKLSRMGVYGTMLGLDFIYNH